MGIIGFIKSWLPGNRTAQVELRGAETATVDNWPTPGDDSQPQEGDPVLLISLSDKGRRVIVAAADLNNEPKAKPGEKRIYSRKQNHDVAIELWLKADGGAVLTNETGSFRMLPNGSVDINGVTISPDGMITIPGGVVLNTHLHAVTTAPGTTGVPQ